MQKILYSKQKAEKQIAVRLQGGEKPESRSLSGTRLDVAVLLLVRRLELRVAEVSGDGGSGRFLDTPPEDATAAWKHVTSGFDPTRAEINNFRRRVAPRSESIRVIFSERFLTSAAAAAALGVSAPEPGVGRPRLRGHGGER